MHQPVGGRRSLLRLAALSGLAFGALALPSLPHGAAAADWPQQHSDVLSDPAIRFGKLPNGMRYAIMRNATPKGAVSMWLNIDAGSLQESDAQQGLAHFLEHMAFRGSRHVPEGEVWPGLQRLGVGIGADANAVTSFTATVYQFNFPRNDAETIDSGLLRLRDIASELTLAQGAMDAERGAILSEERLRDGPSLRRLRWALPIMFPNDRVSSRIPIGQTDVLRQAPVSLIRDYYAAFYRPERATLIVVGEVDPAAIQAKIAGLFADWTPAGPAGIDPVRPAPAARAPVANLFVETGAPSALSLSWVLASQPDTKAREYDDLARLLALRVFGYRLQDVTSGSEHPFAQIEIGSTRQFPGAVIWSVDAAIRPQDWRVTLDAAVLVARRMEAYGITADELDRAKSNVHATLEAAAADAATRPSRDMAEAIAGAVNQNEVVAGPAGALAFADAAFKALTLEKMQAAIRAMMRDHGPLVFVSSPTPIAGGSAAVSAALAAAEQAPLTAAAAEARVTWPYAGFGPAGQVAERTTIADLQTTFIRFANGVRLTVRPSAFRAGEVLANVRIGNGALDLPADRRTAIWAVDDGALADGGTRALNLEDMRRALPGKVLDVKSGLLEDGLMLWGRTRAQDLSTQLQVFAALVSAPGWRAGAIERVRTIEAEKIRQAAAAPEDLFARARPCLLRGDPRWCRPSLDELARIKPDALKDVLAPILASAPLDIIVVGDVTVDAAIDAVARTFGALPRRAEGRSDLRKGITLRFPAATTAPVDLHHTGRADQGLAAAAWPATDALDLKNVQALRIIKSVIRTRLLDQLRIHEGATYSPFSNMLASDVAPGFGYLFAGTELPPDKMPLFFDAIAAIAADLRAHALSPDELERARRPELEDLLARRQTNDYWADLLAGTQQDPRRLAVLRDTVPDLKAVTAEDVRQAANQFLADGKMWVVQVTPTPLLAGAH
jgi:zinc protease